MKSKIIFLLLVILDYVGCGVIWQTGHPTTANLLAILVSAGLTAVVVSERWGLQFQAWMDETSIWRLEQELASLADDVVLAHRREDDEAIYHLTLRLKDLHNERRVLLGHYAEVCERLHIPNRFQ